MPLPLQIGQFNKRVANRIIGPFAGTVSPLAIVEHSGRRSGQPYRTPVLAFPRDGTIHIALTYGPETDWVRNVLAAGQCALHYRRKRIRCHRPEIENGPEVMRPFPLIIRLALQVIRARHVMRLVIASGGMRT